MSDAERGTCLRCGREIGGRGCGAYVSMRGADECLRVALARAEREREEATRNATGIAAALSSAERDLSDMAERLGNVARERDEARAEAAQLREALRIAETTRDAAQAVATRETERRRAAQREMLEEWRTAERLRAQVVRLRRAARLDERRRAQLAEALGKRGYKREPLGRRLAMLGWRHLLDQVKSAVAWGDSRARHCERLDADRLVERARAIAARHEVSRLTALVHDLRGGYFDWQSIAEAARAEADALGELAWRWCIAASEHRDDARANDDAPCWEALGEIAGALGIDEPAHDYASAGAIMAEIRPRLRVLTGEASPFDEMAQEAGPLPTAVLADTPEEPIDSLGPVPLSASHVADMREGYRVGLSREMRSLAWLVRDAVRRGARLEGDDR